MVSHASRGAKHAGQNLSPKAGKKTKEQQGPPQVKPPKGPHWAVYKGVWPGRVLKHSKGKRGVVVYPGLQFKNIHHASTYFIDWPGEEELVEEKWEDVEKWITDEFCTESPWVLKGILAYQENNWHDLSAAVDSKFNADKVKTLKDRKLKEKVWRDMKNQVKSEKFREDPSTTLTAAGDFYDLVQQELRKARQADALAARGPNGNSSKASGAAATPTLGGSCGDGGGGSSSAGVKAGKGTRGSASADEAGGVEVKVEQVRSAADGEEAEDEETEDDEDAQQEWTEMCWTGNRYPLELAFVLGDKTVAETLAEEEADRLSGKPEPEFVVERVMDELRVEVEGVKAPVKYFLVKWEGYELDVQSGLNSDSFGNSWLTEGKLRSNHMAKAWKRSQPGWWLRQQ